MTTLVRYTELRNALAGPTAAIAAAPRAPSQRSIVGTDGGWIEAAQNASVISQCCAAVKSVAGSRTSIEDAWALSR